MKIMTSNTPYTLFHEIMAWRISLKKEIAIASAKFEKARS
jgi:hypothetical protein